ncbi:MAG: hypothetical protein IJ462_00735 [Clostridia bacterium]|nr:hypothetical protein [Clostridia bacterium]
MKKVLVLLMIGILLFSISACADETVSSSSSVSSDTAPIISDATSSTNDVVSSEVTSDRPTISYEGTDVTPPDSEKIDDRLQNSSQKNENPYSTDGIPVIKLGDKLILDGQIRLSWSTDVNNTTKPTAKNLTKELGVQINSLTIHSDKIWSKDNTKRVYEMTVYVDQRGINPLEQLCDKLRKNKAVLYADLIYVSNL